MLRQVMWKWVYESMGNLFRCPINYFRKEYILKAVGNVQEGYVYKNYLNYGTQGGGSVKSWSTYVTYNGVGLVYYEFDATGWNKLHVEQASAYVVSGGSPTHFIGVCTPTTDITQLEGNLVVRVDIEVRNIKDYVLDISKLSGKHYFCLYVKISSSNTTALSEIDVNGDVYLST